MNEQQWLTSEDPAAMLGALQGHRDRREACDSWRHAFDLLTPGKE